MTTETGRTEQLEQFTYDGWAVVEIFGHRRFGAKVKPQAVGAGVFLRCDVPRRDGGAVTQFYNPTSIFSLTPCGEREARAVAYANEPEPVSRWEMKALDAPAPRPHVIDADRLADEQRLIEAGYSSSEISGHGDDDDDEFEPDARD